MNAAVVIDWLGDHGSAKTIGIYQRRGAADEALGVSYKHIDTLVKKSGTDHPLALALWAREIHEARLMAARIAFQFSDLLALLRIASGQSPIFCGLCGKIPGRRTWNGFSLPVRALDLLHNPIIKSFGLVFLQPSQSTVFQLDGSDPSSWNRNAARNQIANAKSFRKDRK